MNGCTVVENQPAHYARALALARQSRGALTRRQRYHQQQRRIYERRGVFVSVDLLEQADVRDPLERRAMWLRCGRALVDLRVLRA